MKPCNFCKTHCGRPWCVTNESTKGSTVKNEIMKFEPGDTIEPYINSNALGGIYTIPVAGLYMISTQMIEYVATGSFELVPNVKKKWYQFWVNSYILKEIYVPKEFPDGSNVKFCYKGEQLPVNGTKFITRIR